MTPTPFEIELLNQRLDVPENSVWRVFSLYWEATQHESYLSASAFREQNVTDIRKIQKWSGNYDGIEFEIEFRKADNKLLWFGVTRLGGRRHEHLIGYIEVRRALISFDSPVDVHIVCSWKPYYLFFKGMSETILSYFTRQPIDQAVAETLEFKSLVERQTHKDIFVRGRAQENIAQALLQTFLIRRSYREVPVRGGQSDILIFDGQGRFLYETKIWKGGEYFLQGLREIEEYIIGEDSDGQLAGIFYILFDPTKSAAARRYRGSDISTEIIGKRTVHIIIININPPKPSKKKRGQ
jgi:hypothetical protein